MPGWKMGLWSLGKQRGKVCPYRPARHQAFHRGHHRRSHHPPPPGTQNAHLWGDKTPQQGLKSAPEDQVRMEKSFPSLGSVCFIFARLFNPPWQLLFLFQVWAPMWGSPPASPLLTPTGSLQGRGSGSTPECNPPPEIGCKSPGIGSTQVPHPPHHPRSYYRGSQAQNKACIRVCVSLTHVCFFRDLGGPRF